MMKAKIYNQEGSEIGEEKLDPKIFGLEVNEGLVHQVVVAQMANKRQVLAHAKDRSEVKGGGRKPWRQKGTGRARHGSIRSPLWIGGGVTFGPTKERNFSKKINKKMKTKALFMCLSDRAVNNNIIILNKLELSEIKTKKLKNILDKLSLGKKILIILENKDDKIIKSASNLPNCKTLRADSLNILDILSNESLLVTKKGLEIITKTYKI